MKTHQYPAQVAWSKEDQAYLAVPFGLPGCIADGQTPEEAIANLGVIIDEWIETATEEGREIPEPLTGEDLERLTQKQKEAMRQQIESAVTSAVQEILNQMAAASISPQPNFQEFGFSRTPLETAGFCRR